jgi:NADH:ubiquinone oxidoreductase subunit E
MKITVCIGSSCHLKGSRQIVEKLQKLVSEHALKDEIELAGTFCMGQCQKGVCVDLDGTIHSVSPETVEKFFNEEVRTRV